MKNHVFEESWIRARALLDCCGCQGHDLIPSESEDDGGETVRSWSQGQNQRVRESQQPVLAAAA